MKSFCVSNIRHTITKDIRKKWMFTHQDNTDANPTKGNSGKRQRLTLPTNNNGSETVVMNLT